jgi:predicted nucleic acid-binding protein
MPSAPVFVDSNILVYSRDGRDDLKQRVAGEWMRRLWVEQRGRISVQVLNEFYWTLTRKARPELTSNEAWHAVELLLGWNPLPIDQALIQRARTVEKAHGVSWWDSLIIAAAQQQGCSLLLTEDLQHGAVFDGVRACNPFVSQVQEEPAPYRVEPISRHRPRGRPRKQAA